MYMLIWSLFLLNWLGWSTDQSNLYAIEEGIISFRSDAPLELIEASSDQLKGVIDVVENTFAFSVQNRSFEGFNSALQREHFNENYVESDQYPTCTFTGKLIEDFDLTLPGTYTVRAKGKLTVHGVTMERIIKSTLISEGDRFEVRSDFTVLLKEHDISIPKIVYQKIAEEIQLQIRATFVKQAKDG